MLERGMMASNGLRTTSAERKGIRIVVVEVAKYREKDGWNVLIYVLAGDNTTNGEGSIEEEPIGRL